MALTSRSLRAYPTRVSLRRRGAAPLPRRATILGRMPRFQAPRGTRDLLPAERAMFIRLERTGTDLAQRYGYQPTDTPLFEDATVSERGVGTVTDVVEKELFRVTPSRGDAEQVQWALRPEPTAGIARAYVQHGMQTLPQPV